MTAPNTPAHDGLTVFLAPPGVDGVLSALADLSAIGLLGPFGWVAQAQADRPVDTISLIENGRARDVSLTELVTARRTPTLRVCSLVPAFSGAERLPVTTEVSVARSLATVTGAGHVVYIRVLLIDPAGIGCRVDELAVEGWHNIVVSPEDSRGPDFGRVNSPTDPSPADLGRYGAPTIAGLCGLWTDVEHRPLDDAPVLPGKVVRLARSFYRRLDTAEAESVLRREVLAEGGELPLPADQQAQTVYLDDVGAASQAMSNAFWRKHSGILKGERVPYVAPSAQETGAWTVIKMFFGFLWASIKNAPASWYNSIVDGVSRSIAIGVQEAVFTNAPAAYEVVVNGRRANGEPAGWAEIGAASDHLGGLLDAHAPAQQANADLSGVWQDYARAALTLSDAGARSSELPPIPVGSARGVVRSAADVVPGAAQRFTAIPGVVAAAVDSDGVDATDPLGIQDLENRLNELQRNPDLGLAAGSTLSALNEWRRRHVRSFGATVGGTLATSFGNAYGEVQTLLAKLRNAQAPPEPDSSNIGLARAVQISAIVVIAALALVSYLAIADILVWWVALLICLGVVFGAVIGLGVAFVSTQRKLFALIHQRRSVIGQNEVDQQNLIAALADLRRLAQAYGQYLSWSRAVGSFLAAPLGPDTTRVHVAPTIDWGMPMSTAVGTAAPSQSDIAGTAGYLRRDLFNTGWLTRSWENLLLSAVPPMPGQRDVTSDASPLWRERGRGTQSSLDRWSTDLYSGRVTSSGADVLWRHALDLLHGSMSELATRLVGTVRVAGGPSVTVGEFLAGIDMPSPVTSGSFPETVLTDRAITSSVGRVATDHRRPHRNGLGVVCAATQFSDALSVDDLVFTSSSSQGEAAWDHGTVPEPQFGTPPKVNEAGRADEYRAPDLGGGFEF